MPGQLVQVGATIMCPHGASAQIIPSGPRVMLGGQPAATLADTYVVAGCPFTVGTVPQPCVKIQWIVPAARVLVGGNPAILATSTGLCLAPTQAPNGPPNVVVTQLRVKGT